MFGGLLNLFDIFYRFYCVNYTIMPNRNIGSKKTKQNINTNINVILKFIYKNYFMYNLKQKNITLVDDSGINNLSFYKMLFLLNLKFNLLYNSSLLDSLDLNYSPFVLYNKFKKSFKIVYGYNIKYFSTKKLTTHYRKPFGKSQLDIFFLIWNYTNTFNLNFQKN
jgi:hypothetical protein